MVHMVLAPCPYASYDAHILFTLEAHMDDARRQVMLAELEDAKAERDRLNNYIEVLSIRLGVEPDTAGASGDVEAKIDGVLPQGDPVSLIYDGELVGMSLPKATAEVLRRFSPPPYKRPIKTPILVKALQKGGLDVKDPRQLYRTLYNARALTNLQGGQWGLSEWYPEKVKAKAKAAAAADGEADLEPTGDGTVTDFPAADAAGTTTAEAAAS